MQTVHFALVVTLMVSVGALALLAAVWGTRRSEPIPVRVRSADPSAVPQMRRLRDGSPRNCG